MARSMGGLGKYIPSVDGFIKFLVAYAIVQAVLAWFPALAVWNKLNPPPSA